MYHEKPIAWRWKKVLRTILGLLTLTGLLLISVGGTIAYFQGTSSLKNQFTVAEMAPAVVETFDKNTKSNVSVRNDGDVDAYIRVMLVFQWKDSDGTILLETPTPTEADYTLTMPKNTNWTLGSDGYYYYTLPMAVGESTEELITSLAPKTPTGNKILSVDVVAQAIQAKPVAAPEEVWNVKIAEDGGLTPPGVI